MATLPRPDVNVTTHESGSTDVVISRDGKGKSYRSEKTEKNEIVKDLVEKVVNDRYTGEWLP
jgi:hypothetical protein